MDHARRWETAACAPSALGSPGRPRLHVVAAAGIGPGVAFGESVADSAAAPHTGLRSDTGHASGALPDRRPDRLCRTRATAVPLRPDPSDVPPPPQPSIADPDPAVGRAIGDAIARLDELGSYRFTSTVAGRSFLDLREPTTFDFGMQATVTQRDGQALQGLIGSRLREADGSAAVSSGGQAVLFGGGWAGEGATSPASWSQCRWPSSDHSSRSLPEGRCGAMCCPSRRDFASWGVNSTPASRPSTTEPRPPRDVPSRRSRTSTRS